jgi:type I restriction enzyme S subunit
MHEGDALYPYYGANGLVDHINQYKIDMTAICLAEDCGKYGPGEETAYIIHGKSWVNNHAHILVPKDNCDIIYAKMLFTIMDLNKYVDNDNRKKLTQANMKKIKILCPPLPLQQQFVEIATQAEATKESLRKSIENIDQVIKSLINQ